MSGANYAHCDVDPCLKPSGSTKVFYIGDEDLPFGTVVRHGECDDTQLAAAEARGYDRAIANLLDSPRYMAWHKGTQETPSPAILTTRRQHQEIARYLVAVKDQP